MLPNLVGQLLLPSRSLDFSGELGDSQMHSFAWSPTLIDLAVATFTDLRNRRIPNWLVLPFMGLGIAVSTWFQGWHGLGQSFAGLALGILLYGFLFWMGGMG